ncbi:MAG: class I SAM-dependent methyltransferase [Myxococcota bacterium]
MAQASSLLAKLDSVAEHRRHFAPLFQRIIQSQIAFLPADGPIVEVGAGDGQFTHHLPESIRDRLWVTEPDDVALERLRCRFEGATFVRASAERLPMKVDTVAAVIGCCVLDVVDDVADVCREVHRILRPGGVFLHLLDMSTDLSVLIDEMVTMSNLCLLPNVFTDPMAAPWPEDLMVVPREQLAQIAGALSDVSNRTLIEGYLAAFETSTLAAIQSFNALHESTSGRKRFFEAFRTAMTSADAQQRQAFAGFSGRPLSSSRVFHDRVMHALGDRFRVQEGAIVRNRAASLGEGSRRSIVGYTQTGRGGNTLELGVHVLRVQKL